MNKYPFRGRAFTALLMVLGFAVLAVSGVVLYAAPRGRGTADWSVLLLGKREWQNVHIVFGLLFLIAAVFHIWMNRKPLLNYIRQRLRTRPSMPSIKIQLEPLAALLLCAFLFAAAVALLPPVSYVLEGRAAIVRLWQPEGAAMPEGSGQGPPPWAGQGNAR